MQYKIVGSTALAYHNLERKTVLDTDIWVLEGYKGLWPFNHDVCEIPKEILALVPVSPNSMVATPDAIYTIKCSHLAWDIKWEKTKADILWLEAKGCKLLPNLYKALKKCWEIEHGNKDFLSLKQDKGSFFNDYVMYKYDHDYLHELVAYPDKPVYKKVLKDGENVLTDKIKFDKLPFTDQVKMFREEISVIAFERWLAHSDKVSWYQAYSQSLKKTITNLTKNWANDFLVLNIKEFIKPDYDYFDNILKTLKGEERMSEVDLEVFHNLAKELQEVSTKDEVAEVAEVDEGLLEEMVINLCDGSGADDYFYLRCVAVGTREILEEYGYKHVTQEGGGEGGAEYCYGVFELAGKTYKAEYSYMSHYGYDFEGILDTLKEVKPVQKMVTVYE